MTDLITRVQTGFADIYSGSPIIVFSPGRINFIGEHTDYNLGFVLPASIDKGIAVAVVESDKDYSVVHALDKDEEIQIDVNNDLERSKLGWANYVLGVVDQLKKAGAKLHNFNCVFGGDIPIGSGLSSSAALENGIGFALNELFELKMDRLQLLHLSQKAEHEFVGVMCGIMDQFSSMMGKRNAAMRLDCRSLEYDFHPVDFGQYQIILLNSNVSHNLASSEYNVRRSQCEEGVSIIQNKFSDVNSLRDVTHDMLQTCREGLSSIVYLRCKYIIEENERVNRFVEMLEKKNFGACGDILLRAHDAMKTEYEITCPEIDILVELASKQKGFLGARMMGGGFGGCTLNLVHHDYTVQFVETMTKQYYDHTDIKLSPHAIAVGDGVRRILQ